MSRASAAAALLAVASASMGDSGNVGGVAAQLRLVSSTVRPAVSTTATATASRTAAKATPWAAAPYTALGAYNGPFTQLTTNFLDGVAEPGQRFGAEDKMEYCNARLVLVDLDGTNNDATPYVYQYRTRTGEWLKQPIVAQPCANGQGSLLPRDNGYTVGQTVGPYGDRLLILGGNDNENSVYYSDDCGITWLCYNGWQMWSPRRWAPLIRVPGILPTDPVIMAGGRLNGAYSVGMFMSYDMGIHWQRPQCYDRFECSWPLGTPDCSGSWCPCTNQSNFYQSCYVLPDAPACAGSLGADWYNYYLFVEDTNPPLGAVYSLTDGGQTGWQLLDGATDSADGRKVFIRGMVPGSGCWFSTDYLAEDLWARAGSTANSIQEFWTSPTATGPWTNWTTVGVRPPWTPRASGALSTDYDATVAWYASGMTFVNGQPTLPGFGDVWQIDVGVCLLGPKNGRVCSGNGSPNLDVVTCTCNAGFSGAYCENGSAAPSGTNSVAVGFGVTAGVLGAAVIGVWSYARFFGGGPRVAAAGAAVKAAGMSAYHAVAGPSSRGTSFISTSSSYSKVGGPGAGSGGLGGGGGGFNSYGS